MDGIVWICRKTRTEQHRLWNELHCACVAGALRVWASDRERRPTCVCEDFVYSVRRSKQQHPRPHHSQQHLLPHPRAPPRPSSRSMPAFLLRSSSRARPFDCLPRLNPLQEALFSRGGPAQAPPTRQPTRESNLLCNRRDTLSHYRYNLLWLLVENWVWYHQPTMPGGDGREGVV